MRKSLIISFLVSVVISSVLVYGQSSLPDGVVTIYGSENPSDREINKNYYVQIYTVKALDSGLQVSFQYQDPKGNWKPIASKTVGALSTFANSNVKRIQFSPTGLGMIADYPYKTRAYVYGNPPKEYPGSNFTFSASSITKIKPTISTDTYYSPQTKSQTIRVSVKDDFGLEKIEVFVDGKSIGTCDITGPISTYCIKTYRGSVGSSHSYYVNATGKSKLYTISDKKSFTIPSDSTTTGATASVITSDLIIFGYDKCVSCIADGMGYNSSSQVCESLPSSAKIGSALSSGRMIIHKKESEKTQEGERSCDGLLSDDVRTAQGLPTKSGDNFYVLYHSDGGYTIITEPKSSGSNLDGCEACFKQGDTGYNTASKKCERGTIQRSSNASVFEGNWVGVLTEAAKEKFVKISGGYSNIVSCEKYSGRPQTGKVDAVRISGAANVATDTLSDCEKCTQKTGYGFNAVANKCEKGTYVGSAVSTASVAAGNWVTFTEEKYRDASVSMGVAPAGSLSCDKYGASSGAATTTTTTTIAPSSAALATSKSCSECVAGFKKGYVTTSGKCETGEALKSSESSATAAAGNWVYFNSKTIRDGAVNARPDLYTGALSCEEKIGTGGVVSTPAAQATQIDPCTACAVKYNMGYVSTNGKCETGSPTGSTVSSASASAGNWVYFTKSNYREASIKAGIAPGDSLSCEDISDTKTVSV